MLDYYRAVLKTAQRETCKLIREHLLIDFVIVLAGLLVGAIFGPSGLAKALVAFGATGGVLLAAVGLLFLWSLAWAPVNLARDDRKRIAELEELTSNKVEVTFGVPTCRTLTADEAFQWGLDKDVGLVIVLPNVSIFNNSSLPVELEADLYIWNAERTATLLERAEDTLTPGVDKMLHRFDRREGQLLCPFTLEAKTRKGGYLVFLTERQYASDMGVVWKEWKGVDKLQLELVNAATKTIVRTQEVSKTIEELIERLEADRGDSQRQSV